MKERVLVWKCGVGVTPGQEERWRQLVAREQEELRRLMIGDEEAREILGADYPTERDAEVCLTAAAGRLGCGEIWTDSLAQRLRVNFDDATLG